MLFVFHYRYTMVGHLCSCWFPISSCYHELWP